MSLEAFFCVHEAALRRTQERRGRKKQINNQALECTLQVAEGTLE
jgi:hypothetical protein